MTPNVCEHGVDWDATCRVCDAGIAEAKDAGAMTPREIGLYHRGKDAGTAAAAAERDGWRRDAAFHAARATGAAYALSAARGQRDILHARIHRLAKAGCGATSAELWDVIRGQR